MSKMLIGVVVVLVVAGAGYGYYRFSLSRQNSGGVNPKVCEVDSDCVVFGEDGDCNCGCFNRDHRWEKEGDCFCAAPASCQCVDGRCEEVLEKSTEGQLKEVLAAEQGRDASDVTVEITEEEENHIRGMVSFEPGGSENSGIFLAARVDGEWKLAHSGQGAVPCLVVSQFSFPVNMVKECVDEDGNLQKLEG